MYGIRIEKVLLCDEERRTIMNLTGRDFLKLLDFTSAEIGYMLDLAADLKEKKKKGILTRWHEFWDGSMTGSNIGDMDRRSWRSLQSMPGFRYGTA